MSGVLRIKEFVRQGKLAYERAVLAFPVLVECNICAWAGRHFVNDNWHLRIACPKCRSKVRHRLLIAALSHIEVLSFNNIIREKRMLHFAPENMLAPIFRKYAGDYRTGDLLRQDVDISLDISKMPQVGTGCFDVVVACDVLEHVENHIKAISEIHRILSLGGYAILTVPQQDGLVHTFEDPTVVTPGERERVFGQSDHLRVYGDDFSLLLESTGFKVSIVSESNFSTEIVQKHVLFPPVLSESPFVTNYRRVFFAQKV